MDPRALSKAESRYRVAAKALSELREWRSFEDFDDAWFTFLRGWKGVYTTLEQGVKGDSKATQWFGTRNAARRKDQLLQYLYQARNDDEHGLEEVVEKIPEHSTFGHMTGSGPAHIKEAEISISGGNITVHKWDADGIEPTIKHHPAVVVLKPVRDRDKANGPTYFPPTSHLGQTLAAQDPLSVAGLGLAYIRHLLDEAVGFTANTIAR